MSNHKSARTQILTIRFETDLVEEINRHVAPKGRNSFIKCAVLDALRGLQKQSQSKKAGASSGTDNPAFLQNSLVL